VFECLSKQPLDLTGQVHPSGCLLKHSNSQTLKHFHLVSACAGD
jgi:hypothetical protein